ncbi:MAG: DUF58 domain-containing protein [Dehalococcoidia bacterium]|nr:DUF58 domain-containing protein [Dehalococcoidia bacterium]
MTLLVLAFGLATGFPVFHRTFYILGLLFVLSFGWVWLSLRNVEVEVHRATLRTWAGQSIKETVSARLKRRAPWGLIEVREQSETSAERPGVVLGLEGSEATTADLEVACPTRGVYTVGPAVVEASDPFNLWRLRRTTGGAQRVVVHPTTTDLPGFVLLPADLPGEGPVHQRSPHVTTSAYGVRDYIPGDTLSRISWKTTARLGRLMAKEFEMEPANNIWVLVDLQRQSHSGPAGRAIEETTITVAASICRRYSEGGFPVGLAATGNERVMLSAQRGAEHLLRMMDALAALRAQGHTPLLEVIANLHARAGRYTSVAIVTPSRDDAWLDGVRHLLEGRSRITVVIVDGDTGTKEFPDVTHQAAAVGVPVYAVKVGRLAETGLIAVQAPSATYSRGVGSRGVAMRGARS